MLRVSEHIELLLLDNNCVNVAGLGSFRTSYGGAIFTDSTHTFVPPSRELHFTTIVEQDDTLLASTIANQLKLSLESAEHIIASAVERIHQQIANGEKVAFGSLGEFSRNEQGGLVFEASPRPILDAASLGFAPIALSPLIRTAETVTEEIKERTPFIEREDETIHIRVNKYHLRRVFAAAVIILFMMLISAPVEQVVVKQDYAALLSTQLFKEATVVAEASPTFELPSNTPLEEVEVVAEPVVDNRCYWIVVSSLPNIQLAEAEIAKLSAKHGIHSFEIHPSADRVRISLQGFDNLAAAQTFLKEQQTNPDFPFKDAWVLKNRH